MRGSVQQEKEVAMRVLLAGQMCHFLKKLSLDSLLTRAQLSNIEISLDLRGVDERCKTAVNWVVGYRLAAYDFEEVLASNEISYEHKCAYLLNNGVTSTYVTDTKVRVVKWVNGAKDMEEVVPVDAVKLDADSDDMVVLLPTALGPFNSKRIRSTGLCVVRPRQLLGTQHQNKSQEGSWGPPKKFKQYRLYPVRKYLQVLAFLRQQEADGTYDTRIPTSDDPTQTHKRKRNFDDEDSD
eukprot:GHVR01130158.1.p1 GENE.GHVR01130158.1~~GHVR01130158.1.p1  ORF type:complete len:238 (+),score=11.85 GHVR01130158.1:264-977(+)